jgi:hypothetical protein
MNAAVRPMRAAPNATFQPGRRTMQTTTTTAATTNAREKAETKVKALVDTAADVAMTWAKFGLSVGRQALENNAKTLHLAAESLGKLAAALEAKKAAEAAPAEPKVEETKAEEPKVEA